MRSTFYHISVLRERRSVSATAETLSESIDVRLLANLSENFRTPYEALFELVDNGLASRLDDQPVAVSISGASGVGGRLTVVTCGGVGMGVEELRQFLHWGKPPSERGLHRYGQGGKAAIGYLGEGMRIRTNRHDEAVAYQLEDDNWRARPLGLKTFTPATAKPVKPGVGVVQVEIVRLRRAVNLRRLERELAWRYRPALTAGHLTIKVSGRNVAPLDLGAQSVAEFAEVLEVPALDDPGRSVRVELRGWVGIAESGFAGRGGVRCSAEGRVVLQNEYFGQRTASHKASLNGLIGEVDLWFVPVVLNKNAFDTGSAAWRRVEPIMFEKLQPYVQQLLRRREPEEPSDEERRRAMEAKDLAQRALHQLAADAMRPGTGGDGAGRKRPEKRDEGQERSDRKDADVDRSPRTPPPSDAVGQLTRKGRAIEWDVRALDQRTRSATLVEGSRVEIVINNRYPAYRQRAGDLLYMLETGLLETLKPDSTEDKSVDEYHQDVTDALFLALQEMKK
jgi:hypothetical protein